MLNTHAQPRPSPKRPMPLRASSSGTRRPASRAGRGTARPSWRGRCARSLAQSSFSRATRWVAFVVSEANDVKRERGDAQLEEARDRIEAPLERERLYAFARKYARRYECCISRAIFQNGLRVRLHVPASVCGHDHAVPAGQSVRAAVGYYGGRWGDDHRNHGSVGAGQHQSGVLCGTHVWRAAAYRRHLLTGFLRASTGDAVLVNSNQDINQPFGGTMSFTGTGAFAGTNLITFSFSDQLAGAVGAPVVTLSAGDPPDLFFNASSDIFAQDQLGAPRGFSIGFSDWEGGLAISGTGASATVAAALADAGRHIERHARSDHSGTGYNGAHGHGPRRTGEPCSESDASEELSKASCERGGADSSLGEGRHRPNAAPHMQTKRRGFNPHPRSTSRVRG